MTDHQHRAELEIYDVFGMFKQAYVSFRASIPLFLTLALLSSVYETAMERSALLSGLSLAAQNSNFSFQFSLDPKTHATYTPYNELNGSGLRKLDSDDSLLSRLLTALLPHDDYVYHTKDEKLEDQPVVAQDVHGPESHSSPVDVVEPRDRFEAESENLHHIDEPPNRDIPEDTGIHSNTSGEELSNFVSLSDGGVEHDQKTIEEIQGSREDEDGKFPDYAALPRLKIESSSNSSKAFIEDTVLDANDPTLFAGKFLGGRGLDQGAMPEGGTTMLLLFLLVVIAVTIFLAVVGFQHAAVLGSVSYCVISTHMGKRVTARQVIKSSLKSSMGRLMWLAILHATLRGLGSLVFMKTLFGSMLDMEQVEQLALRLSAKPFAFLAPFTDINATSVWMAIRIGLFVGFDYIFDGVSYCLYVVACWVTIMERSHWGLGAVSRSCNLVKSLQVQALSIRIVETLVCGRTFRWLLQHIIGHFGAAFIISTIQVYFLVLWLIFYMSARSIHDQPLNFSYRTLEDFLDRFK